MKSRAKRAQKFSACVANICKLPLSVDNFQVVQHTTRYILTMNFSSVTKAWVLRGSGHRWQSFVYKIAVWAAASYDQTEKQTNRVVWLVDNQTVDSSKWFIVFTKIYNKWVEFFALQTIIQAKVRINAKIWLSFILIIWKKMSIHRSFLQNFRQISYIFLCFSSFSFKDSTVFVKFPNFSLYANCQNFYKFPQLFELFSIKSDNFCTFFSIFLNFSSDFSIISHISSTFR